MTRLPGTLFALILLLAGCGAVGRVAPAPSLTRGEYLVKIMDCTGCHTPGALAGRPDFSRFLGGGDVGFRVPGAGVSYPPNLTSDPESGLGRWSAAQIVRAVKYGERPDGRRLSPAMPWAAYSALSDADAAALAAYLKTVPAVRGPAPANAAEGRRAPAPYLDLVVP